MNKRTLAIIAFLFLICLVFYWKVLFTNKFSFPWDMITYYYPSLHFIHEQVRHGSFPLWDPYVFGGFPIIGDPQAGTVYPLNYLLFLSQMGLPLRYKAVECLLVFHYFLAGLFMYIFARSFRISQFSALIAGLTYMLSGYMVSHAQHMATTHSMAWIPLIFYFARLSFLKKSMRYVVLTGLTLGLQSLIGYVQMAAYTLFALMLFYLWELSLTVAETKQWRSAGRLLGYLAVMLIVFAGVAAVLMIPTYELGSLSIRKLVDFDEAVAGMSPVHLISLLLPNFFGGLKNKPMTPEPRELTETLLYIGVLPLILAFLSLRQLKHLPKRDYFWPVCSVLFTALSFGGETFLAEAIYYLVPGFNYLHRLVNYFAIANVCLCLLAGLGMNALTLNGPSSAENKPKRADEEPGTPTGRPTGESGKADSRGGSKAFDRLVTVAILFIPVILAAYYALISVPENLRPVINRTITELLLLLVFFIAGTGVLALYAHKRLPAPVCKVLLLAILIVDLFGYHRAQPFNASPYNPHTGLTPTLVDGSPSLLNFLRRDNPDDMRAAFTCMIENGPNVFKVRSINGTNPIMLRGTYELLSQFFPYQWFGPGYNFNSPLIDLFGIKYIVTCEAFHERTQLGELPSEKYDLAFRDWYRVYRNKSDLSPVGFFPQALTLADDGATLALLNDASFFDPRRVLLLKKSLDSNPAIDPLTVTPFQLKIEAEYPGRRSTGRVETARSASNGKFFAYWGKTKGDFAQYSFDLPKDLERCTFAIRYCSSEGADVRLKVTVTNGDASTSEALTLPPLADWSGWHTRSVTLRQLKKGKNTLTVESLGETYINTDSYFIVEQPPEAAANNRARVKVVDYQLSSVTVEAVTDRPGFLFINEIYYPGWKAYVDGQEQAVLKANSIFRAVHLKAGKHTVVFKFRPVSFYIGAAITLLTLLALVAYFFGGRVFFKGKPAPEERRLKKSLY